MNPNLLLLLQTTPAGSPTPADAPPQGPLSQILGGGGMLIPMVLCFGVFWFLMIRPEQKARKARAAMLAAIKKGDKVMTNGGLYGTIVQVQDQIVTLQVADGVRMRFAQSAIQSVEQESSEKVGEVKPT